MSRSLSRFALPLVLTLAAACADSATAPRSLPPHRPAFALTAPVGVMASVVSVTGKTAAVAVGWTAVAGASGYYVAFSDPADVQSTQHYQIVYGGTSTAATVTVDAGCYLVSVFAWSLTDADSPFATAPTVIRAQKGKCR